jgi:hypothetical protein
MAQAKITLKIGNRTLETEIFCNATDEQSLANEIIDRNRLDDEFLEFCYDQMKIEIISTDEEDDYEDDDFDS